MTPLDTFNEKAKLYKAHLEKLKDVEQINDWCNKATHGLIKNIIKKVTKNDVMLLINAVYFKGIWEDEFKEEFTMKRSFFNYKKEKQLIDFMSQMKEFNYFENNNIQAISLNYKNDNMKALIILPKNENDINNYIKKFNKNEYNKIINSLFIQEVELYLPKFKIEYETGLNNEIIF